MASLEPIRAALLAERARLLDEIGEAIVAPGQMTYGSQAAAASQVFAQQRDLALRDRSDQQLVLVDGQFVLATGVRRERRHEPVREP